MSKLNYIPTSIVFNATYFSSCGIVCEKSRFRFSGLSKHVEENFREKFFAKAEKKPVRMP
jgi:hypothetical protein